MYVPISTPNELMVADCDSWSEVGDDSPSLLERRLELNLAKRY